MRGGELLAGHWGHRHIAWRTTKTAYTSWEHIHPSFGLYLSRKCKMYSYIWALPFKDCCSTLDDRLSISQ